MPRALLIIDYQNDLTSGELAGVPR